MSRYQILESCNENLRRQVVRLARAAAPPAAARFYGTLSYEGRGADHRNYLATLTGRKTLTGAELEQLIVSQLRCKYNFTCEGVGNDFGDRYPPQTRATEFIKIRYSILINAYIVNGDYHQCLDLFVQNPALTTYEHGAQFYVKCLLWCGYINECCQVITQHHTPKKINKPELRIFYLLQRALCYWHLGKLTQALDDCDFAWETMQATLTPVVRTQSPAIYWLRAQINHALGRNNNAIRDLKKLMAENSLVPAKMIRPVGDNGLPYLQQYIRLIGRKRG